MNTNSAFTSKLPVSSVRRPTQNRDGSTSFVGLNRPSNIPVTVRKPNIFTPKAQRPFMTGASTAGKSYMSIMTSEKKKYSRPLKPAPDRDMQMRMFEKLVEFFRTNAPNLPPPEAKKFFSSVSTTESSRIFELLISKILPDFKITKLETDVPEALAMLDYPYIRSVTKSALVSVTTRQAAVGLLVIFDWLIGYIRIMEPTCDPWGDEEPKDDKRRMYKLILTNPPGEAHEALDDLFNRLYPKPDLQGTMRAIEEIRNEIENLERDLAEVDEAEQEIAILREDTLKAEDYCSQMENYVQGLKDNVGDDIEQQLKNLDMQNEEKRKRNRQLQALIENHEFTLEDVRKDEELEAKLQAELKEMNREVTLATQERDRLARDLDLSITQSKEMKDELLNQMKKLHATYKNNDFASKLWTERRLELESWISRIQQCPHDDLEQNIRLQHEHKLFLEKWSATDEILESEIMDGITDERLEVEALEASNDKWIKETRPRLLNAIDRAEREAEEEVRRGEEELSKLQVLYEEAVRKKDILTEKRKTEEVNLKRELDIERERFEQDKKDFLVAEELNKKYLKELKERAHFEAVAIVKQAQLEADQLREARSIAEENCQISKRAYKLLKKKLDL